ncbi:MAG: hypothetical protein FJ319_09335 [SAR202 cluster bacterium]|nr:hypothetical protein [SAR202 cluster bacterium]
MSVRGLQTTALVGLFAILALLFSVACSNDGANPPAATALSPTPEIVLSPTPTPIPYLEIAVASGCTSGWMISAGECVPDDLLLRGRPLNSIVCWRNGVPCSLVRGMSVPDCQGVYCSVIIDASGSQAVGPGEQICQNDDGKWKCIVVPTVGPEATAVGKIYCRSSYCYHAPATSPNGTPLPTIAPPVGTPESFFVPNLVPKLGPIRIGVRPDSRETELLNSIAGYAIVYGYSYAVELVSLADTSYPAALDSGKVDVVLDAPRSAAAGWYEANVGKGIADLGSALGEDSYLRMLARAGLKDVAPDVYRFLDGFQPGKEQVESLAAMLTGGRTGVTPIVAAITFCRQKESTWTPWVEQPVAEGSRRAIDLGRVGLVDYACIPSGSGHKGYTELFVTGYISGSANCGQ